MNGYNKHFCGIFVKNENMMTFPFYGYPVLMFHHVSNECPS